MQTQNPTDVVRAAGEELNPLIPHLVEVALSLVVFAILFFGIMTDAGLLAPLVNAVLRMVGERPSRITVGTALLALLIHLDGSGAVCFLITIPALRPLYDRLGMDRRVLACTASMAAGVNFLPWTGPTLRAGAALKLPVATIFTPMIGVQVVGLVFVFVVSWWLGVREERRLGLGGHAANAEAPAHLAVAPSHSDAALALRRPRLFLVNVAITLVVVATMLTGLIEPVVVLMAGTALALIVSYPSAAQQRERIDAHARGRDLLIRRDRPGP